MPEELQKPQDFMNGWRDRLKALRNLPPVWRMLWKSGPALVTGSVVFRTLGALLPLAMLAVTRWIIDGIVAHSKGAALPDLFWWMVGLEFGLAALGWNSGPLHLVFRYAAGRPVHPVRQCSRDGPRGASGSGVLRRSGVRRQTGTRAGAGDRPHHHDPGHGYPVAAGGNGSQFLRHHFLLFAVAAGCFNRVRRPRISGESHFAFQGYSLNFSQTPVRRQIDYLRMLGASKESAKELKLFGLGPFFTTRFAQLSKEIHRQNKHLATRRLWAGTLLSLLTTSGYYGTYAYVIYRTVAGDLSIGTLTFLTGAIAGASNNIQTIFSTFSNIADQALFLTDLIDFFSAQPVVRSRLNARPAPRPIRQGYVFDRVSFAYPGNSRLVLDNLSFRLEPGERLALIGENGEGKTTIVKLLTHLYEPTGGRILLDGIDLQEYSIEDLFCETGVIFQDFMRYEMTARDNIAVGRIERQGDLESIEGAARKSLADEPISRLPLGFEQMLGRRFEGRSRSFRRRVAENRFARAYLRDAQLLILDEPTASLDARSEYEVFQRFSELTEGKMAIVISHRFSSVRMADRILVLEQGRIAEEGSHDNLMALGGRYAAMFELQASGYR